MVLYCAKAPHPAQPIPLKTQQSFILIAILLILATGAVLTLGVGGDAVAKTTVSEEPAPAIIEPRQPPDLDAEPIAIAGRAVAAMPYIPPGPAATSGTIYGRLSLATDVLGEFNSYTITWREMINPNSRQVGLNPQEGMKSFKVDPHRTPRFMIEDIPFSRYGYEVELFVVGFNGSRRSIQLNEEHPVAGTPDFAEFVGEEIVLSLSSGVPFSLRLHDQHFNPISGRELTLVPVGSPRGRQRYPGKTDSFGTMIFENMLRGDYDVKIDQTILDRVTVQASKKVMIQGAQVLVPMGNDLRIEVNNRIGYGIEGINLLIYAVDTTQNRRREAQTDYSGIHVFPHLMPGTYQLDIWGSGYQRTSRKIRITKEGVQKPVQVRLSSR